MKKLEVNQMENLNGGFVWRDQVGCAVVGVTMSIINPALGVGFGLWCSLTRANS